MSELQEHIAFLENMYDGGPMGGHLGAVVEAARLVVDASELAGGGDQWIMDWEGELIHPTDLPAGRYLVIPIPPGDIDA